MIIDDDDEICPLSLYSTSLEGIPFNLKGSCGAVGCVSEDCLLFRSIYPEEVFNPIPLLAEVLACLCHKFQGRGMRGVDCTTWKERLDQGNK